LETRKKNIARDFNQPDAESLARVIELDTANGAVSMSYGDAITLVDEHIASGKQRRSCAS